MQIGELKGQAVVICTDRDRGLITRSTERGRSVSPGGISMNYAISSSASSMTGRRMWEE